MDARQVWQSALERIQQRVSRGAYTTWFRGAVGVELSQRTLVVTPSSESKEHPGGLNGAQSFISTTACQPYIVTYTFIEYLPPSLDTATLFSLQPPPNYHPGVVQSAFTCQEQ